MKNGEKITRVFYLANIRLQHSVLLVLFYFIFPFCISAFLFFFGRFLFEGGNVAQVQLYKYILDHTPYRDSNLFQVPKSKADRLSSEFHKEEMVFTFLKKFYFLKTF